MKERSLMWVRTVVPGGSSKKMLEVLGGLSSSKPSVREQEGPGGWQVTQQGKSP